MHGILAFVAGVCTTIGVLLIVLALAGITYYGIAPQAQLALALAVILIAAIAAWILYYGLKARRYKIETGKEALIGSVGKAVTDFTPNGTVRVLGEFWQATSKSDSVRNGQVVRVVGMEGMFLIVQPVEEKA